MANSEVKLGSGRGILIMSPSSWMATGAGRAARSAARGGAPAWRRGGAQHGARRHRAGIGILTIFSFSSENWSRPRSEILDLMALLRRSSATISPISTAATYVRVIGEREGPRPRYRAPPRKKLKASPAANTGLRASWSRSTTAPARRLRARRGLAEDVASGRRASRGGVLRICWRVASIRPDLPDPDLVIRTSEEQRLSNFLLLAGRLQRAGIRAGLLAGF